MAILGIDAGTTGITALLVDSDRNVIGRGYQDFPQHFPNPGWVEHDPNEIWTTIEIAVTKLLKNNNVSGDQIICIGITNQRETILPFKKNGDKLYNAIVWQDKRTNNESYL